VNPVQERLEPGSRIDQYQILGHLAEGAQANVYRARDLRSGEVVACKVPHARVLDNAVFVARWRREAQLTETLRHPNIERRRDVDEPHSRPYLVFDYAAGGSVDTRVGPGRTPLPIDLVVRWSRQLAHALDHIHNLGIVHRDLKPGNLLLTDNLDLVLGDFGAAATAGRRRRVWSLPVPPEGTPEYLSPEQVIGEVGDERSDVYGWGVVVYEMLTGHVPFGGTDPVRAMQAHLTETAIPIRDRRADVPPALAAVVHHALRRQPEHRYQTAAALLTDLDQLDTLEPNAFDPGPDPPMRGPIGGREGPALVRLVAFTAATFITIATALVVITAVVH
jgi:eukaryotic-like serine/threonine-protein kinase